METTTDGELDGQLETNRCSQKVLYDSFSNLFSGGEMAN